MHACGAIGGPFVLHQTHGVKQWSGSHHSCPMMMRCFGLRNRAAKATKAQNDRGISQNGGGPNPPLLLSISRAQGNHPLQGSLCVRHQPLFRPPAPSCPMAPHHSPPKGRAEVSHSTKTVRRGGAAGSKLRDLPRELLDSLPPNMEPDLRDPVL